jgi:hypothetical protein
MGVLAWIRRVFSGLSPLRPGKFGFEVNEVACIQILLCHGFTKGSKMDSQKVIVFDPSTCDSER